MTHNNTIIRKTKQSQNEAQLYVSYELTSRPLSSGVRSSTEPEITLQRQSKSDRYPRRIGVPAERAIFKNKREVHVHQNTNKRL